jgi:hypothetical protein
MANAKAVQRNTGESLHLPRKDCIFVECPGCELEYSSVPGPSGRHSDLRGVFQAIVLPWPHEFFRIARTIQEQGFFLFTHPIYAWAI